MQLDLTPAVARTLALALACGAAVLAGVDRSWQPYVEVPGGVFRAGSPEGGPVAPPREAQVSAFSIGRTEVTCAEYALYLTATTNLPAAGEHQFNFENGRWYAGEPRHPVAWVSHEDAQDYCRWLSASLGHRVRLPTADEWECAARGGIHGARFPWGWGSPRDQACFDAAGPCRVASFKPNRYGLHEAAGNLAEWCEDGDAPDRAFALGGSWADRNPDFLRVFHRVSFPRGYRDGDVGFRVVVEVTRDPG